MIDRELRGCLATKKTDIPKILEEREYKYTYSSVENIYNIELDFGDESEYSELKDKQFCFNKERRIIKVYLCNKPSKNLYDWIINDWIMENSPYKNSKLVHRGHYIANKFQEYLIPNDRLAEKQNKINHFFGKGNVLNIYPQSAESNCGPYGQLIYERKVWNFLDGEEKKLEERSKEKLERKVYYEVENIIIDDKVSVGRRIKAAFFEGENLIEDECFHVFIPNIYRDK